METIIVFKKNICQLVVCVYTCNQQDQVISQQSSICADRNC